MADCARAVLPVLYVHGATFPSGLSIAHRFDGFAWRDALCAAGFDVWGLDFQGFGHSDRYPEMEEVPDAHAALCRTEDASATTCSQPGAASSLIIRTCALTPRIPAPVRWMRSIPRRSASASGSG
jgi:pimeloyl-ACP methyl ester carboxylesterase